jgi:hypothetical protein
MFMFICGLFKNAAMIVNYDKLEGTWK